MDSKDSLFGANQFKAAFGEAVLGVKNRLVLNDAAWGRMAPLIIGRPDQKGSTGRDNRMSVDGVLLWIVRTGSPWRDLPEAFGDWNSLFRRFSRWSIKGVWWRIFEAMSDDPDFEYLIIDSTIVRTFGRSRLGKSGAVHTYHNSKGRCAASRRIDRGITRRSRDGRYGLRCRSLASSYLRGKPFRLSRMTTMIGEQLTCCARIAAVTAGHSRQSVPSR